MKTKPISPRIHQLTQWGMIHAFLVQEEDGFTLVDTCMNSADAIVDAAAALGHPIRRIALTHSHLDHIGSLDALVERVPGVQVMVGRREIRLMRGDRSLDSSEPPSPLRGSYRVSQAPVAFELEAGDRVHSLEVIATPGHTPGHLAFLDTRSGVLMAGDAWSTPGGVTPGGRVNWLFPLPAMATWDRVTALASARRLCAREPAVLAVGHGAAIANPVAAMRRALEKA